MPYLNPVGVPNLFISPILGAPELIVPSRCHCYLVFSNHYSHCQMVLIEEKRLGLEFITPRCPVRLKSCR